MYKFKFNSFNPSIRSSSDVARQLKNLNDELSCSDYEHVLPFNKIYLLITEAVVSRLGTGYFKDDDFINRFDVRFAYYYLRALREHASGRYVAPAWDKLFSARRNKTVPRVVLMALGVNAHVNNDIPQVLMDQSASEENLSDYLKVNAIIKNEVADALAKIGERAPVFKLAEQTAAPIYRKFMKTIIVRWRANAWRQFLKMAGGKQVKADVERKAALRAARLASIKDPLLILSLPGKG